jgi:hypothetical protein
MILFLQIAVALMAVILGLFLFFRPSWAIEFQIRFYAVINWRIEPISIAKEIRNTKLMGAFLVVSAILIVGYFLVFSSHLSLVPSSPRLRRM